MMSHSHAGSLTMRRVIELVCVVFDARRTRGDRRKVAGFFGAGLAELFLARGMSIFPFLYL